MTSSTVERTETQVTDNAEKVRENRLRRAADRQGFKLRKSARRDPRALDYGIWYLTSATGTTQAPEQGMTLDEIEQYLTR